MRSRLEIRDGYVHLEVGGAFDAEAGRRIIGELLRGLCGTEA